MNINMMLLAQVTLLLAIFYLIPVLLVAFSKKVSGSRKIGWLILTLFLSWISYALMLIVAPRIEHEAQQAG